MFSPNMLGWNLWKIKKVKPVLNGFVETLNESNGKPNKLWVGRERRFYNKLS